ncbi:ATP synthase subunit b [Gemmatirosa kalamazoonensis]|jgi:F-type H+-transporting ATPase subunit b|uniref:ATP synthase subunit b n=1 Tax=Gemmatirosa kalamazoonensis TaxID=861299 RepID=W0RLZ7_9BACT|nr:F0F1 ATP synthase subunit B [Gemmatirosa kalamazoonensis]AHG91482.1 ATP synthase subunit b [Gemmatirosa kalamazoonensis]
MRTVYRSLPLLTLAASPLLAQEHEAQGPVNLLEPHAGLMFWTLVIFVVLLVVLSRFAFKPLVAAVEARERTLEDAIQGAKRDRDEAARLLAEQRAQLDASRGEAQKLIADGRAAAEKMRAELLEQTRQQQQELLERARRDIDAERDRAIADLRREAVDLAIAGASKVIERNLDDTSNRQLVENFLGSLQPAGGARR